MSHRIEATVAGFTAAILTACAPAPAPMAGPTQAQIDSAAAATRTAIEAANNKWEAAVVARDSNAIAGFWTEDAVDMETDGDDIVGRSAIAANAAKDIRESKVDIVSIDFVTSALDVYGDRAYEVGTATTVTRPKGKPTAKTSTTSEKYITFWQRGSDGQWRVRRDFSAEVKSKTP